MQTTVDDARAFAIKAHGFQKYGDHPYSYHLDAVVEILKPFGEAAQKIGYLHDVVEDTPVTFADIKAHFGEGIALVVSLVTDEPGVNRKERKAKTNAKLASVAAIHPFSIGLLVKAADRLANLRMSAGDVGNSKLDMYRREHAAFKKAVFRPGLCDQLWTEMDQILVSDVKGE